MAVAEIKVPMVLDVSEMTANLCKLVLEVYLNQNPNLELITRVGFDGTLFLDFKEKPFVKEGANCESHAD